MQSDGGIVVVIGPGPTRAGRRRPGQGPAHCVTLPRDEAGLPKAGPGEVPARRAGLERGEGEELMVQASNGMPASALGGAPGRKGNYSNPNRECVEGAALPGGATAMRNSRDHGRPPPT